MHNSIVKEIKSSDETITKHLFFICPGCRAAGGSGYLMLPINGENVTQAWWWNDDLDKVTLSPSILTGWGDVVCHSYLVDGVFEYLSDSTHPLAGQKIPMIELEYGVDPI